MSQHCRANPCCGDVPCTGIPLPQHASGLVSHNKDYKPEVKSAVVKKPIDAVLHNAVRYRDILIGNIEADCKQRFQDGTLVTTSKVIAEYGNVFYTKNSVYYVADWVKEGS